MRNLGKRAISPLVATVLLVAFAVSLGAVVMSWAQGVDDSSSTGDVVEEGCLVEKMPADPLKALQVKHIRGQIGKSQYLEQQQTLI